VNAVSWSSTLNLVASASDDNAIKLWGSDAQQERLQVSSTKPKVTRQFTTKFHEQYMGESSDSDRSDNNLHPFSIEDQPMRESDEYMSEHEMDRDNDDSAMRDPEDWEVD
jgi:hypothetical protein